MTSAKTNEIIWTIVFAFEGTSIVFLNILGLVVFRRKIHRIKSCYLLMNQCFADLLIGVKVIFFAHDDILPSQFAKYEDDDLYCGYSSVKMMLWGSVIEGSLASLALIAMERVYAVFKPFKHRVLKPKHYIIVILSPWTFNLVRNISLGVGRCYLKDDVPDSLIMGLNISLALIELLTIVISYVTIYIKMKFFSMSQSTGQGEAQARLSKTLFYATIASFLTIVPAAVVESYKINVPNLPVDFQYMTLFIVFSNSLINFVIYSWRIPGFGKDLKNALCCKKAFPIGVHPTDIEMNPQSSIVT